MTLDLKLLLAVIAILSPVMGLAAWFFAIKHRAETNAKSIHILFAFKDEHEKESALWRSRYSGEMAGLKGRIEGLAMANSEQFKSLVVQLAHLEKEMEMSLDRMEKKIDRLEARQ